MKIVRALCRWLRLEPSQPTAISRRGSLRIPSSLLLRLRGMVEPTPLRHEPLAIAIARFASELVHDVVVIVDVIPMPEAAYVEGPDGANFDTRSLMAIANRSVDSNAGIMLVHTHKGLGRPEFGQTDSNTNQQVIAKLALGIPTVPYGAILLSDNHAIAVIFDSNAPIALDIQVVTDTTYRTDLLA